jgi:hypothetical protein
MRDRKIGLLQVPIRKIEFPRLRKKIKRSKRFQISWIPFLTLQSEIG